MNLGMLEAIKYEPEFLFIANDDIVIIDDALLRMITAYSKVSGVIVAPFVDSEGLMSYSGMQYMSKRNPLNLERILPQADIVEVHAFNGNLVMIPKKIYKEVGVVSKNYSHAYGDLDYSFRIRKSGHKIYLLDEYIGLCNRNSISHTYLDKNLNLTQRLQSALSRKGVPFNDTLHFYRVNGPIWWPFLLTWKYIKLLMTISR